LGTFCACKGRSEILQVNRGANGISEHMILQARLVRLGCACGNASGGRVARKGNPSSGAVSMNNSCEGALDKLQILH
jgi:hypothetical protein